MIKKIIIVKPLLSIRRKRNTLLFCRTNNTYILQLHAKLVNILLTNIKYLELTKKIHLIGNNYCSIQKIEHFSNNNIEDLK